MRVFQCVRVLFVFVNCGVLFVMIADGVLDCDVVRVVCMCCYVCSCVLLYSSVVCYACSFAIWTVLWSCVFCVTECLIMLAVALCVSFTCAVMRVLLVRCVSLCV